MISNQNNNTLIEEIMKSLISKNDDGLKIEEGLTIFKYPEEHRQKIRTSNGIERINREIKRRTRVAVIFPNEDSALRLITAILVEIHEDWIVSPRYLNMELLLKNDKKENYNFIN